MTYKEHKVTVQKVVGLIPEGLLLELAAQTKVDYCAKVLQGERLFYLLLYSIIRGERVSQRHLEGVFESHHFKFLFNYPVDMKVTHSSISEKLSKINLDFFYQAYQRIYQRYNELYTEKEQEQLHLIRIDSSMVCEAGSRLKKGMLVGCKKKSDASKCKKQVKYTMAYDGQAVCRAKVYTDPCYLSEDIAIPSVLVDLIKADKEHRNIYTFDRGMSSLANFDQISSNDAYFVGRIKTNRKTELVSCLMQDDSDKDLGALELISDDIIRLYDNKNNCFGENKYRLIKARRKIQQDTTPRKNKGKVRKVENDIHFITNNFDLSAKQITDLYKKRWDIEVFFRFIKQELNFKHFLSVNENGLQVVLYMTLISAMLLMVYKKLNSIGFVTAKRRFCIELEDIITLMAIEYCGGDVNKFVTNGYRRPIPK